MVPITAFIVEDQEDVRRLMRAVIHSAGDDVVVVGEAASGPDALVRIQELEPDVVILDQMLPGMSGIEVAAEVRRLRPGQVLIMCSAFLDRVLSRQALAAGFAQAVSKSEIHAIPAAVRAACSA